MVTLILLVLLFILKKRKKKTVSVDFKYAEVSEVNLWNIKFVQIFCITDIHTAYSKIIENLHITTLHQLLYRYHT